MTETPPTNRLPESLMNSIEEHIVTGEYPPGTRLEEVELAETFGVSRTPIREALIRLAATGMIERRPRKGWAVTEVSPNRLCEMFDVMAELEAMCGRLAARRATTFQQQKIRAAHEACRGVSDADAYFRLNEDFHFAIYDASGNGYLVEKVREVQRQLRPFRRLQLRVKSRLAIRSGSTRGSSTRSSREIVRARPNGCALMSPSRANAFQIWSPALMIFRRSARRRRHADGCPRA